MVVLQWLQRACFGALGTSTEKLGENLGEQISKLTPNKGKKKVTMIPGDGIGPEMMNSVKVGCLR